MSPEIVGILIGMFVVGLTAFLLHQSGQLQRHSRQLQKIARRRRRHIDRLTQRAAQQFRNYAEFLVKQVKRELDVQMEEAAMKQQVTLSYSYKWEVGSLGLMIALNATAYLLALLGRSLAAGLSIRQPALWGYAVVSGVLALDVVFWAWAFARWSRALDRWQAFAAGMVCMLNFLTSFLILFMLADSNFDIPLLLVFCVPLIDVVVGLYLFFKVIP